MASNYNIFFALAVVAIVLPRTAMATEYVVGDDQGWKLGINYTEWASGKVFYVGDTLVFHYQSPHNVYKVDGAGFKACNASGPVTSTGNDTFTLAQPGKKWYICGYADHCLQGQKLVIDVQSDGPTSVPAPTTPAPAPTTPAPAPASSDSYKIRSSWFQISTAAVVVMAMINAV